MKAINTKKIVALTTGLAMVGATIFGAAAQDLSQYPSPLFIKDGVFDGSIVVGELAKTSDVVGSIELAAGLQAAAVKKTAVSVGVGSSTIDKGVKIDKTGTHVGPNRFIQFVQDTALDESDLPNLLADGLLDEDEGETKNKVDYDQELTLISNSGQLIFTQDDDDAPTAGWYLHFADNANMYNFTLDFDENVDYDNTSSTTIDADFNTAKLSILGKEYTITDVNPVSSANTNIDKITMLAGDTTRWLTQDEPLTREISGGKHTFVLVDVNENEDKCGISVDGTIQWVDVGSTKTVTGIQIGVTDAITVHSAGKDTDVCEVNLGATELELKDGNNVKLNGVEIDGSTVDIVNADGNSLRTLGFVFEPDDDVYLDGKTTTHYTEPIFDAFTFWFDGMNSDKSEVIDFQASGSSATLKYMNSDNKEVKIQWKLNDTDNTLVLGTGAAIDDRLYLENQFCDFVTAITECEGGQFLVITAGGEAHVVEIIDFDTSDSKITLKDVTYGSTTEDDFTFAAGVPAFGSQTIDLGAGAGAVVLTVQSDVNETSGTVGRIFFNSTTGNGDFAETSLNDGGGAPSNQGGILLHRFRTNGVDEQYANGMGGNATIQAFNFTEEAEDNYGGNSLRFNLTYDTTDEDINILAPAANAFAASAVDASDTDDDHEYYVTNWSTEVYFDSEDNDFAKITYYDTYRFGQIFIGEAEAKITSSGGSVESVEVQQIPVGSAKLDKDITDWAAQNLVVVGGPCANTVAAALMGNPADCTSGFKDGEGIIKLYKADTGKVALLAAGYSALDTRRVTRVLANYKDYAANLKGTEVKVTGTTLTDVTVSSVA
ncbi:S-layer protein [Candidatus Woesearchaeota archaeon]|nr:S-layer protein [Candidatus Woesearchaeota archaeon]